MAGPRQAFIEIPLTVFSNESWRAGARVTAHTIHTLSSIQTVRFSGASLGGTVVHVLLALDPYGAKNRWISWVWVSSKVINFFQNSIYMLLKIGRYKI